MKYGSTYSTPVNLIKPDQVEVYVHADYNDVWLYNETHDDNNLFLLSKDALTVGRHWPDYATKDGKTYKRDQQFSTPQHLDHSSYFGMRKYVRTGRVADPQSTLDIS
jgi:hypothetical protein